VLTVVVVLIARWALRTAPAPDWPLSMDVDHHAASTRLDAQRASVRLFEWDLAEKVALVGLIAVIFSQVIPGTDLSALNVVLTVGVIVVGNAAVSQWLTRRGHSWTSTAGTFLAMVAVNGVLVVAYFTLFRREQTVNEGAAVFLLLLLTLLTTLDDRYRPLRAAGYDTLSASASS
jgi:hypothetical protein